MDRFKEGDRVIVEDKVPRRGVIISERDPKGKFRVKLDIPIVRDPVLTKKYDEDVLQLEKDPDQLEML